MPLPRTFLSFSLILFHSCLKPPSVTTGFSDSVSAPSFAKWSARSFPSHPIWAFTYAKRTAPGPKRSALAFTCSNTFTRPLVIDQLAGLQNTMGDKANKRKRRQKSNKAENDKLDENGESDEDSQALQKKSKNSKWKKSYSKMTI